MRKKDKRRSVGGLWHMADHHRYHQAHINRLRLSYAKGEMGSL
ncbi:hypothetical protein [Halalkalibacterium halodurans]